MGDGILRHLREGLAKGGLSKGPVDCKAKPGRWCEKVAAARGQPMRLRPAFGASRSIPVDGDGRRNVLEISVAHELIMLLVGLG